MTRVPSAPVSRAPDASARVPAGRTAVVARAALVGLVIGLVGACGGGGSQASPVATTSVDLPKSYRFEPAAITVPVGATVTWTNNDNFTHNVALEGEQALLMAPGEQASYTFEAPGPYPYVCSLHPQDMTGTVIAVEP